MAEAISVGAPAPRVRKVELDRPWAWLAAGWRDLTRAPAVSLTYGVLFAVIGWAVTFGLWWAGMIYLILPLTAGFLIMGPILAVGLYEVSRRHEQGRRASLGDAIAAFRANPTQIAFMGVTLCMKNLFGLPPIRDVERLREAAGTSTLHEVARGQ